MRFPAERIVRSCAFVLILAPAWMGCAAHSRPAPPVAAVNGPSSDYPVVIGAPYTIGKTLYTPVDAMNYDEVGHVAADGGTGITGASHTLPLPSYAEVTSLDSGHTILVRIERRGPMNGDAVVALTPAALAQLGAAAGTPVRVRRVNPPEEERAALRAGRNAPARMDTPASLLAVLKRKLPDAGSASVHSSPGRIALARVDVPASAVAPQSAQAGSVTPPGAPKQTRRPAATPTPATRADLAKPASSAAVAHVDVSPASDAAPRAPAVAKGEFQVQAATMSTLDRARKVADAVGGSVSPAGKYFRVRTGPFANRKQAEASLAKVRAAGYSDARILTNG
jgi:rare lipoprotein A